MLVGNMPDHQMVINKWHMWSWKLDTCGQSKTRHGSQFQYTNPDQKHTRQKRRQFSLIK